MGVRAKALEDGYRAVLEEARAYIQHPHEQVRAVAAARVQEAQNGLLFLDGLKNNLYSFSKELHNIPDVLEPAKVSVQKGMVPIMDAVLLRAETHLQLVKRQGMTTNAAGGMGVWYNPATWVSDAVSGAESAVEGMIVKAAFLGLGCYAAYKLIQHVSNDKSKT